MLDRWFVVLVVIADRFSLCQCMWSDLVFTLAGRWLIIIVSHIDLYRLFTFLRIRSDVFNDWFDAERLVS